MSDTLIDLSQIPAPAVIEPIDFEATLEALKNSLLDEFDGDKRDDLAKTLARESSPLTKTLEAIAYQVIHLQQRINEDAKAVMLAYATGTDLDNLAALFGVQRLTINEGEDDEHPESDSDLRERIQLSLIGMSTAGPEGAYIYWARSAHPDVADAAVSIPKFDGVSRDGDEVTFSITDDADLAKPLPGDVVISVLSRAGNGVPDQDVLDAVHDQLYRNDLRPITDHPIIQAITPVDYHIQADITVFNGPDFEVVKNAARDELEGYIEASRRVGRNIAISGIYRALHRPGVAWVELHAPAADIEINNRQAANCTNIDLTYGGTDE